MHKNATRIQTKRFGNTELDSPPLIFGTSSLGNLYCALSWDTKLAILREMFEHMPGTVVLDSAGKYGAGLALEVMDKGLTLTGRFKGIDSRFNRCFS